MGKEEESDSLVFCEQSSSADDEDIPADVYNDTMTRWFLLLSISYNAFSRLKIVQACL